MSLENSLEEITANREARPRTRRRGLRTTGRGAATLGLSAVIVVLILRVIDRPEIVQACVSLGTLAGIAGLVQITVGGLQWLTGKPWSAHPEWFRLLAILILVPATLVLVILLVGVLSHIG